MVGEIVHAGMGVNISREKKTLPTEAPAFPPEMTNDRATGHWGGPLSFDLSFETCRNQSSENDKKAPGPVQAEPGSHLLGPEKPQRRPLVLFSPTF